MDLGMYWLFSFFSQFCCNMISNCSNFTQHLNTSPQYDTAWSSKIYCHGQFQVLGCYGGSDAAPRFRHVVFTVYRNLKKYGV